MLRLKIATRKFVRFWMNREIFQFHFWRSSANLCGEK